MARSRPWRAPQQAFTVEVTAVSTDAAQLRFAAEFATFLVAAAGLSLALLRPSQVVTGAPARALVALGFCGLAVASFLHGSLLVPGDRELAVIGLRIGGIAALAIGSVRWAAGRYHRPSQSSLWGGLLLLVAATALVAAPDQPGTTAGATGDWMALAGAVLLGISLLLASQRSIATRVAAGAGTTL